MHSCDLNNGEGSPVSLHVSRVLRIAYFDHMPTAFNDEMEKRSPNDNITPVTFLFEATRRSG